MRHPLPASARSAAPSSASPPTGVFEDAALPSAHDGQPGQGPTTDALAAGPRVSSASLLRGSRELEIVHGDAVYRLRLTAMGKLILTK